MSEYKHKLDFLANLSFKLSCPLCNKYVYAKNEELLYEELAKHLKKCSK